MWKKDTLTRESETHPFGGITRIRFDGYFSPDLDGQDPSVFMVVRYTI